MHFASWQQAFHRQTLRLGAIPSRWVIWVLTLLCSLWVVPDVFLLHLSNGLARPTFDAMVRHRLIAAPADSRLVILDIDEASLADMAPEFGRWPWPRDTLATVLDHIESQRPAAIVWDVAFADLDKFNPGGDAAFNAAAARSPHSHFPVIRLPRQNDSRSQLTRAQLPSLWLPDTRPPVTPTSREATVALIPPALPALTQHQLGYNNGYPDSDGLIRRYRFVERLSDGSAIQSIPISVAVALQSAQTRPGFVQRAQALAGQEVLLSWRSSAQAYPRVRFSKVFRAADGEPDGSRLPSFEGKIVLIGSTAPSLHDLHPTPQSNMQPGIDTLATAIDDALHERWIRELPASVQAALAVLLILGLAVWVQFKGPASLEPALFALPLMLLAISYASLHSDWIFLDFHLPASLALLFLAAVRLYNNLRLRHWTQFSDDRSASSLVTWMCPGDPARVADRIVLLLEQQGRGLRLMMEESPAGWPQASAWPELRSCISVYGPQADLEALLPALSALLSRDACQVSPVCPLPTDFTRMMLVQTVWASRVQSLSSSTVPAPAVTGLTLHSSPSASAANSVCQTQAETSETSDISGTSP